MSERYLARVSCKVALYTPDGSKVLAVEYSPGNFGLPGGHIEAGEHPDDAMHRELHEELGLKDLALDRKDFWLHDNGKLILGFIGTLHEDASLVLQEEELRSALWVPVVDVESGVFAIPSYDQFIVRNQPRNYI